ncbi:MAG: FtsH protease activity modulator HflK [Clostridia bacterium]|nr:FtsH protease activity modulator HflK [Clostridia bacterium]
MNFTLPYADKTKPPKKPISPGRILKLAAVAAALLIVLAIISGCWYTVSDKQEAVVTTFGRVTNVTGAGMHFKLPLIQHVQKVDVNVFQKIYLGYRPESGEFIEAESKMITGDFNIVNVDFFVEYKISDPEKYLFASANPDEILTNLVQSQIRNVIGSTEVDRVLTTGKNEIQTQIKELVTAELEQYDIGLALTDVKIQDSEPPNATVIEAFKNVETAMQLAETVINEARAYQNSKLPEAKAQADKLIQNAEYVKRNRINEATKQIAMFEAMYAEYALNPAITRTRMYYEMISEVLPGVKLYIDTAEGGTEKLLPLESFLAPQTNGQEVTAK